MKLTTGPNKYWLYGQKLTLGDSGLDCHWPCLVDTWRIWRDGVRRDVAFSKPMLGVDCVDHTRGTWRPLV